METYEATAELPALVEIVETTLMPVSQPFQRRRTVANSWWCQGCLITPLVTSAETHGAFALLDMSLQCGAEPATCLHQREDKTIVVLEGHLRYHIDDEVLHAGPGDAVHLPRGHWHSCQLESDFARVLMHVTPGGYEHFLRAQSAPAQALVLPPLPPVAEKASAALLERFGLRIS